ncbi:MAG TPA: tetratricopeptide repeat protein [Kofleriaceae bacterium]|nr:tetratricopeptide repeat protein [Kofleriaceae bacterium]
MRPTRSLLVSALAALAFATLWAGGSGCSHAPPPSGATDPLARAPADLLLRRGRAFAAAGDTIRAEQYLVAASHRGAEDRFVAPILIGTCIRGQRYRAALAHIERFVRRHPRDIQLRQLSAVLYLATGSPDRAQVALRRVIEAAPDEPRPRRLLARAEREMQRMRDGDDLDGSDRMSRSYDDELDQEAQESQESRVEKPSRAKKASKRHRSSRRSRRSRR